MRKEIADAELEAAKLQAKYFKVLVVDDKSSLPQETDVNNYSVLQGQSAIAHTR